MAKAKLTADVAKWVDTKGVREKAQSDNGKVRQTIYVSQRASKLLWQRRVDAGVPVSRTVEDLVIQHLA